VYNVCCNRLKIHAVLQHNAVILLNCINTACIGLMLLLLAYRSISEIRYPVMVVAGQYSGSRDI